MYLYLYITKYLVLEEKYIASTSRFVKKIYIIIYFFSYSVQFLPEYTFSNNSIVERNTNLVYLDVSM